MACDICLRDPEMLGCTGEAAGTGDGQKYLDAPQAVHLLTF